jgi:putative transposase
MNLLSADSVEGLRASHYRWVEEKLKQNTNKRDAEWTESIGVGSRSFLRVIKEKLGYRARGRSIIEGNEPSTYQLRESQPVYGAHHHGDMNNLHPWDI